MNFVINCLTAKSIWDDLILYHEGPYDVKESRVMDIKLCYNTFKFKEGETLTQTFTIYKALMTEKKKSLVSATPLLTAFFSNSVVHDFQDSTDDEEDTKSIQEYLNNLDEEYLARALLAKSKRFFKQGTQSSSQHKPKLRPTKDFEAKYNKVKAKLALLSLSTSASKASMVKNKGLIAEAYEWDEEEVSLDENDVVEVKLLMALAEDNDVIIKEGARNGEWVKISMRKCINEQILTQNKRILRVDQLIEGPSSFRQNDLVFVKSLTDDTKVSIPGVKRPWLSEAEGFILPNHDTGRILPAESQRNTTDPPAVVSDSLAADYDSPDESSVCSTLFSPLKKLDGVEPISGLKTIKSILRIISLRRGIKPINPQHVMKSYETCGSIVHTTTDHNDNKWFRIGSPSGTLTVDAQERASLSTSVMNKKFLKKILLPTYLNKMVLLKEKNKTLIEVTITMLSGSVFSKQHWNEAITIECYTQNRSTFVKRYLITPYEIFRKRIPNIDFLHVFGCPVFIYNHKDHLGKFDEKADDGYFLDTHLFPKPSESPTYEDNKLKKPITSYLMKALMLSNSQNFKLKTSTLLNLKDIHLMIIFILMSLYKGLARELSAALAHECLFVNFLSEEEPKKAFETLQHPGWVDAMQDELNQFSRNKVWTLVPAPYGKTIVGLKWVFRNKRDETRFVIKNKARLIAQCYNQQEGIDYDETFSHVARLEAIKIFLAFSNYMNFIVYQIDVKSAFINGKLKEEVYVKQPLGFESSEFPNHVCKLDKALYRLKQAPKAWYETLSTYLTKQKFVRDIKKILRNPTLLMLRESPDSDYAGCNVDRKSTLAEAEYLAVARCCANILWMKSQLTDYDLIYEKDHILKGDIELHFIPTQYQLALDELTFKRLIIELDMLNIDSKPEPSVLTEEN
nr:retrovirus-related Pol polyprotein from transposon TNT 1-94 [Tanacetum cinerariifolium]